MFRLIHLLRTSIGSKLGMAASGLVLLAFLAGHMVGNMKLFQGQAALNDYAVWLQGHPMLWVFRVTMLLFFLFHAYTGVRLAWENRRARPQAYVRKTYLQTGIAARFMLLSGTLVLGFLVYHLLHLTLGVVGPQPQPALDAAGRPDVYARVVAGFRNPWFSVGYLLALGLLGFHLHHAIASLFQTLGLHHDTYQGLLRILSPALTLTIVAGFASVPVSVLTGLIPPP